MKGKERESFGEPVPPASQLAALSFLSAVEGFINWRGGDDTLRLTLHRIMSIESSLYIQQLVPYLGSAPLGRLGEGRLFPVTAGAIGEAYRTQSVVRTKHYDSREALEDDIQADMKDTNDTRDITAVGLSYLAIPVLGPLDAVVAILYSDTRSFNFFGDDENVVLINQLLVGFCELLDDLEESPLPRIKNFPVTLGQEVTARPGVYGRVQEVFEAASPPRLRKVSSINYEIIA